MNVIYLIISLLWGGRLFDIRVGDDWRWSYTSPSTSSYMQSSRGYLTWRIVDSSAEGAGIAYKIRSSKWSIRTDASREITRCEDSAEILLVADTLGWKRNFHGCGIIFLSQSLLNFHDSIIPDDHLRLGPRMIAVNDTVIVTNGAIYHSYDTSWIIKKVGWDRGKFTEIYGAGSGGIKFDFALLEAKGKRIRAVPYDLVYINDSILYSAEIHRKPNLSSPLFRGRQSILDWLSKQSGIRNVYVFDADGRIVQLRHQLIPGLYFVRVEKGEQFYVFRFLQQ